MPPAPVHRDVALDRNLVRAGGERSIGAEHELVVGFPVNLSAVWSTSCGGDPARFRGRWDVAARPGDDGVLLHQLVARDVLKKAGPVDAPDREVSFYERRRQPLPRLGPWRERLDGLLAANAQKAARERLTLIRIFEELQGLGFVGSYAAVRRYALRRGEEHSSATAPAYIPLSFVPGEAYQFDCSREVVLLYGVTTIVKVAHVRLCHSRLMFVRA